MINQFEITFIPSWRGKAQCESNPNAPNGVKIETDIRPACTVDLPYPAPECGGYYIKCNFCQFTAYVTAAGRPDDPVSVMLPCNTSQSAKV
jgi:hypothetical protein